MRESSAALAAFLDYQRQTPPRSLARLAEEYRGRSEGIVPTRQLSRLQKWSQQHAWQERILAHERALAEQATREDAEERKKARKARLGISYEAQDKVLRKLRSVPPEQMTMRAAVSLLHESWDAQRRDLGEATERVEVTGKDGAPITVIEVVPLPARAVAREEDE